MLKSVVLFALLCQFSSYAKQHVSTDTRTQTFTAVLSPKNNATNMQRSIGNNNFIARKQIFNVKGSLLGISGFVRKVNRMNRINNVRIVDNPVTNETPVFKVHRRSVAWGKARQLCLQEGGHLAVIKSQEEEKIVLKMMTEQAVNGAWVGYHDQFVEGDWVSVFDEPLDESGWERWTRLWASNPDNYLGNQNCGVLIRKGGGMDDDRCDVAKSFVCRMSTI